MKNSSFAKGIAACAAAVIFLLGACASTKTVSGGMNSGFGSIKGKVWQLSLVRNSAGQAIFDKTKIDPEKFKDVYTLQFDDANAVGKAAPNRFNAPYSLGNGDAISFKYVASTLMASFNSPEGLNENGFYKLLEKASRWSFADNQLTIYTTDDSGAGSTLIFKEIDYK
jgi:heat shock protein HslJ